MKMKISKRDISIILVILGLFAAFLSYQFLFRPTMSERDDVIAEREQLEREYNSLKPVIDNQQTYSTNTANWEASLNSLVQKFPAYYLYEDGIMYLRSLEANEDLLVYFDTYTVTETLLTDTYSGRVNGQTKTYAFGNSTIAASFTVGTYDAMKSLISAVYSDSNPKNIESISMNFNQQTGELTGSMNLNLYSLTDGTNAYTPPTIPEMETGLECIFGEIIPPEEEEEPTPTPVPES